MGGYKIKIQDFLKVQFPEMSAFCSSAFHKNIDFWFSIFQIFLQDIFLFLKMFIVLKFPEKDFCSCFVRWIKPFLGKNLFPERKEGSCCRRSVFLSKLIKNLIN